MNSNLCLYNAMHANCLLDNMSPVEAKAFYGKRVEAFMKEAYKDEPVPPNELLAGPGVMGTASILQVYLQDHPALAFLITYAPDQGRHQSSFFLFGAREPIQVFAFKHIGSPDGGHFEAGRLSPEDRERTLALARKGWSKPPQEGHSLRDA